MTSIPFTQARADQIVAGVNQTDAAAFAAVLALPDNLVPLPAVAANTWSPEVISCWSADERSPSVERTVAPLLITTDGGASSCGITSPEG